MKQLSTIMLVALISVGAALPARQGVAQDHKKRTTRNPQNDRAWDGFFNSVKNPQL